jgi:glycosyltransferase involved in cell wall biosynthesis
MHIAYVSADPGVPPFGTKGASVHVQEMLRAFLRRGAAVTLISPRLDDAAPADLAAVKRVALPPDRGGAAEARADWALATNQAVAAALAAAGPFDFVYERHALFAHGAMMFAAAHRLPSVLEVNAPLIEEQARHRNLARRADAERSARRAFAAAGLVVAVSDPVADYARSLGAADARLAVIPNGVDPARFPARQRPSGPFTIGFVGTLKPWHDVATLVEAVALLRAGAVPDARLLVVGDGPARAALADRVEALGIPDAVNFTSAVPATEVPGWLARMHAAVAPYRADEPFYFSPLKLYEYMAARLPVVASRVGHLTGAVADERTGLLVPGGDAPALAHALARLATDPALCDRLGAAARAEVEANHTWDRIAARVLQAASAGGERAVA